MNITIRTNSLPLPGRNVFIGQEIYRGFGSAVCSLGEIVGVFTQGKGDAVPIEGGACCCRLGSQAGVPRCLRRHGEVRSGMGCVYVILAFALDPSEEDENLGVLRAQVPGMRGLGVRVWLY